MSAVSAIAEYVPPDAACIDVGAHGGSWSVALARLVPKGRVYAFEALPYYTNVLRWTLRLLRIRNVAVINSAVKDDATPAQLVWKAGDGSRLTGLTHLRRRGEPDTMALIVPGITLDEFMKPWPHSPVAVIKCDVEGAELHVLKGAAQLLERWRPVLYVEMNEDFCRSYGHAPADVFQFVARFGYQGYTLSDDGIRTPVDATNCAAKTDVLFLPEH